MVEEWGIMEERGRSGGKIGDNGRKRKKWWKNGNNGRKRVVEEWGVMEKR